LTAQELQSFHFRLMIYCINWWNESQQMRVKLRWVE
jgi:hypothetical protein